MKLQDPLIPIELRIHIDEAGRGPLAGPVWVGGIIQTATCDKSLFRDSKTLTAKRRDELYQIINHKEKEGKFVYAGGHSSAGEIDEYGIIGALRLASIRMIYNLIIKRYRLHLRQKLLESVRGDNIIFVTVIDQALEANRGEQRLTKANKGELGNEMNLIILELDFLRTFFDFPQRAFVRKGLIIDGNHRFGLDKLLDCNVTTIIKGDAKNPLISAASIVAKVERDDYMKQIDSDYPSWGFGKHKGYGTKRHRDTIATSYQFPVPSKAVKTGNLKQVTGNRKQVTVREGLTPEHRISFLSKLLAN